MMEPPEVKALVFDVFGTLVDWHGSIVAALETFGRKRGIACDWTAFVDAWRTAYVPSINRVRSGERSFATLDTLQAESLDVLIERFALPALSAADRTWIVMRWHALDPWPEVVEAMTRLRERYALASLSNGNVSLLVDLARHARLPFDTLFSGELFGRYKPDPQTYLGAARLLGRAPSDVMLVAAHESDLHAAAACGLKTAFVSRPNEWGRGTGELRALPPGFDVAVRDLGELASLLTAS